MHQCIRMYTKDMKLINSCQCNTHVWKWISFQCMFALIECTNTGTYMVYLVAKGLTGKHWHVFFKKKVSMYMSIVKFLPTNICLQKFSSQYITLWRETHVCKRDFNSKVTQELKLITIIYYPLPNKPSIEIIMNSYKSEAKTAKLNWATRFTFWST